jgi:hypothetical protein
MLMLLIGCATTEPSMQLANPRKVLSITVESVPSGAQVYGLQGTSPSSLLGTTPLEFKYTYLRNKIYGSSPDQTLDFKLVPSYPWSPGRAYLAFKCLIIADGYKPYSLYEVLEDRKPYGPGGGSQIRILWGGVQKQYTALLQSNVTNPVIGTSVTAPIPQQQQQQQQQTVILPTNQSSTNTFGTVLVSSDVQDAEVFIDGVFVGNTPATLKLSDGIHIIEVKKTGNLTYKRELRVFGNSEVNIRATMK